MSKVTITKGLLDDLADTISDKSGESTPMTIIEMTDAVDNMAVPSGTIEITSNGIVNVADYASADVDVEPNLQNKSVNYTPSETAQSGTVEADSGYDGLGTVSVSVGAVSSSYVGSGVDRRTSSDLTASGATVTAPAGYYENSVSKAVASGTEGTPTATKVVNTTNAEALITPSVTNTSGYINGGTKTGTAFSVTASELVSGNTLICDDSGEWDVTKTETFTVGSGAAGTPTATKGTVSNHSVTVTPSVTNTTGWITGSTKTGTGVTVTAAELASGNKEITANGTNIDVVGYSTVSVEVEGGSSSDTSMQIGSIVGSTSSTSSISFTGLRGEPTAFSFMIDDNVATGTPAKIVAVVFDGTNLHAQTITNTSNAQVTYDSTSLSKTYLNGTLTITSSGPSFVSNNEYYGTYAYNGGAVDTKNVQVGSGATNITFTGLEKEPALWSCIFKSNFGTSSGYQRVIYVGTNTTQLEVSGLEMDSGSHNAAHWTSSYNNGSLTITSQGTNAGGYFHQPGNYQLTYVYDDGSGGDSIQWRTIFDGTVNAGTTASWNDYYVAILEDITLKNSTSGDAYDTPYLSLGLPYRVTLNNTVYEGEVGVSYDPGDNNYYGCYIGTDLYGSDVSEGQLFSFSEYISNGYTWTHTLSGVLFSETPFENIPFTNTVKIEIGNSPATSLTWETIWEDTVTVSSSGVVITSFIEIPSHYIASGLLYRITFGNDVFAVSSTTNVQYSDRVSIAADYAPIVFDFFPPSFTGNGMWLSYGVFNNYSPPPGYTTTLKIEVLNAIIDSGSDSTPTPTPSGPAIQVYDGSASSNSTTLVATSATLTIEKAGTYDVSWAAWKSSSSGTFGTRLYINDTAQGNENTTWSSGTYGQYNKLTSLSLNANDVLTVYARSRGTSYTAWVANLTAKEVTS